MSTATAPHVIFSQVPPREKEWSAIGKIPERMYSLHTSLPIPMKSMKASGLLKNREEEGKGFQRRVAVVLVKVEAAERWGSYDPRLRYQHRPGWDGGRVRKGGIR